MLPGAALFDLQTSFAIIRGGHVDATVLGALEVNQDGSIANWIIPENCTWYGWSDGYLLVGAKKLSLPSNTTTVDGQSAAERVHIALSAKGMDLVITELAVLIQRW